MTFTKNEPNLPFSTQNKVEINIFDCLSMKTHLQSYSSKS